jgi:hypothetical protein
MTKRTIWNYFSTENQSPVSCELLKLNWLGDFKSVSKDAQKKKIQNPHQGKSCIDLVDKVCSNLNPVGELIKAIARCEDLEIYGTEFVQAIDKHILVHYFNRMVFILLIYVYYFLYLVIYLTFFRDGVVSEEGSFFDTPAKMKNLANLSLVNVLLFMAVLFF